MAVLNWTLLAVAVVAAALAAGHVLLNKRDPRAALGWIATCLMFPLAGPVLYSVFGVNRIRTRARKLDQRWPRFVPEAHEAPPPTAESIPDEYAELARISRAVTGRALVTGNKVELLHNGEQAYPAMLEAIEQARKRIYLATYIFETNKTGRRFVDALATASRRGADVRVLIDGFGEWYDWPRASLLLRRHAVRTERFLPPRLIPPALHVNLRNHRKILAVDGRVAFTGGINIGDRHLVNDHANPSRVADMHFRLEGRVVSSIEQLFLEDWAFASQETTEAPPAVPPVTAGSAICRIISDGPNEDLDKLLHTLIGALSAARQRVRIMTPYFVPPRELIAALQAAALRGVSVEIILPERNNLPIVHWATRNLLWQVLQRDVAVFYQPPPFAHTKLLIVDDHYTQIGSANLDARSLRLNFELVVEVYDRLFAHRLADHFDAVRERSRPITLAEVDERPLPARLRDAIAWLFSPYL